jgi:hypothetical protein
MTSCSKTFTVRHPNPQNTSCIHFFPRRAFPRCLTPLCHPCFVMSCLLLAQWATALTTSVHLDSPPSVSFLPCSPASCEEHAVPRYGRPWCKSLVPCDTYIWTSSAALRCGAGEAEMRRQGGAEMRRQRGAEMRRQGGAEMRRQGEAEMRRQRDTR